VGKPGKLLAGEASSITSRFSALLFSAALVKLNEPVMGAANGHDSIFRDAYRPASSKVTEPLG
jgi:hypothetical protein